MVQKRCNSFGVTPGVTWTHLIYIYVNKKIKIRISKKKRKKKREAPYCEKEKKVSDYHRL